MLEKERKETDVEKDGDDVRMNDESQSEGKIEALAKEEEESKDEGTEEKTEDRNDVKAGGD